MGPKKQGAAIGSQAIRNIQNAIDTDSDSYGSQGGLKEKPVFVPKRGGKKRNKNNVNGTSIGSGETIDGCKITTAPPKIDWDKIDSDSEETMSVVASQKSKKSKKSRASRKQVPKNLQQDKEEEKFEDTQQDTPSRAKGIMRNGQVALPTVHQKQETRDISPPMIEEYNPNEENAKTRAAKRREELKKRENIVEIDKNQYPDDPTPWKSRPADFFLLHTPRRGTHKVMNNSQKEFILIYYPDSVADPISLMDFLYRQAKNHEERLDELENEKYKLNQNAIIRGSKNKKKNRQQQPAKYVNEMKHVNEEQIGRNRTTSARPMNFEQLLTEGSRAHGQNANLLFGLRNQISLINERAEHKMQEADMISVQHSQAAGSTFGFCSHCHHHMTTTDSNFDQIEIKRERQAILQQICEAKKRQARMEAEEARRLQDEAQRLAQMANILELESQRPLLEARRLEEEAMQMETQYGRLTRTFAGLDQQKKTGLDKIYSSQSQQAAMRAQQQPMAYAGRQNVYQSMYEEQKTNMMLKKQQLLLDQRRTQMQIQSLQQDASQLNTRVDRPRSRGGFIDSIPQHLQAALDHHGRQPNHQHNSDDLLTGSTPQARMAIAEANAKAMAEKSKRERLERELIMKEKEKQQMKKQKEEESKAIAAAIEEALKQKKAREAKEREKAKQKFIDESQTEGYGDEESSNSDNDSEDEKQSVMSKFSKASSVRQIPSSKVPPQQTYQIKKREQKKQEPEEDKQSNMDKSVKINSSQFNENQSVHSFDSDESKMSVRYTKPKKDKKKEEKKKISLKKKKEIENEEDRILAEKVRNAMKKPEKVELDTEDKDPYLAAADKEFEAAKKAFEAAQKLQNDAHKVKNKMLNAENEEILRAQREAEKFFLEKKRKLAEEEKRFKGEFKRDTPNNYQNNEETEYILKSFNNYMERIRREKWKLKERFASRKVCKEFLQPILSGKILQDFDEKFKGYINFRQFELKDNFENGHQEYFAKWRHLFLYETYSFLMNSRWSKMTGSELELKNQIQKQASDKALCWKGYFQTKGNDNGFTTIKMYREPPNVLAMTQKGKNFSKIYDEPERREGERFELTHCREEDLIVISKFRINLDGQEDIKMAPGGMKFLKEVLNKPGVIFGLVNKCSSKTDDFVEVLIDARFMGAFSNATDGQSTFTRYCYFYESVLTCMREFRAMKCLEFTRLAPSICYPTLALEHRDKIVDEYSEVVNSGFEEYDNGPNMFPKAYEGDEEKSAHQMNNYLLHNHELYNKSQARVLEQVIEMPKDEVALIQGPPGTGKTHTIIGIISMIMSTRMANSKQKILVCAPSNAAIDQILSRIVTKGLVGLKGLKRQKEVTKKKKKREQSDSDSEEFCEVPDLTHSLLRITSAEYQTEHVAIKKHTLEQRIIKKLCIEKFGELRKCIKDLKDMLQELEDFDAWDEYPEFPFVNGIKFKGYTKVLKDASLNSVHDWGNVNMTRTQQKVAMQQQLKIHERELNEFKTGNNVHQGNQEWKEAEKAIIAEAKIICCTLSMAGSAKMQDFTNQFEYLIVDEACQSTEPCTLIPFALAPRRVILVGDQKQLPATTFSSNSEETGYCRSLFERLLDSGYQKTMLTIQFRMHPKIRAFPSEQFYGGAITDHQSIGFRSAPLTISNLARVFSSRMIFFDIAHSEEVYDNKSKCNMEEADFTKVLIDFMARKMSLQGTLKYVAGQIGVISPYKAQVRQLYSRLEKLCSDQGCNIQDTLEVNTVDAFQGSEKDVIIFNCVRSNSEHTIEKSLGFLLDERRLNVAITRPKFFLLVVGNSQTLRKSYVWDDMIEYAQNQGKYIHITDRSKFETMNDFKKHVVPQFLFD